MAYTTIDDVRIAVGGKRALVELADLENEATVPDDITHPSVVAVVGNAIKEADGIINGYLKQRVSVPLAIVPDEIAAMSAGWSARVLRRNRYRSQPIAEDQTAEETDRKYLADIAKGIIQLGIEPTPEKSSIVIDKAAPRDSTLDISRDRLRSLI